MQLQRARLQSSAAAACEARLKCSWSGTQIHAGLSEHCSCPVQRKEPAPLLVRRGGGQASVRTHCKLRGWCTAIGRAECTACGVNNKRRTSNVSRTGCVEFDSAGPLHPFLLFAPHGPSPNGPDSCGHPFARACLGRAAGNATLGAANPSTATTMQQFSCIFRLHPSVSPLRSAVGRTAAPNPWVAARRSRSMPCCGNVASRAPCAPSPSP